jgi:hypothetical protein
MTAVLHDGVPLLPERLEAREVGVVAEPAAGVLEGRLADLPLEPRAVHLDRLLGGAEGGDHRAAGCPVSLD